MLEMKSQIRLAVFLALCLSNASSSSILRRDSEKRNMTLDELKSQGNNLQKQLKRILSLIDQYNNTTNGSQSESPLTPTGSVPATETKSSTNAPQTEKLSSTPQGTTSSVPETQKPDKQVTPTTQTTTKSVPGIGSKPASTTKKPDKQVSTTAQTTNTNVPGPASPTKKPDKQVSTTTQTTNANVPGPASPTKKPTKQVSPKTTERVPGNVPKPPSTAATTPTQSALTTKEASLTNTTMAVEGGNHSNARNNTADTSQRNSKWFQQSSNFPVIFMVLLVAVVAVYFAYHNRNRIHRFIKEGYGKAAKQSGKGYVKVKVDDDIELPREANREYVY